MLSQEEIFEINPDIKDMDRATAFDIYKSGSRNWFHGNGAPITSLAAKQAKLIRDPRKMIRRAKATILIWGYRDYNVEGGIVENVWNPFEEAMRDMGFNEEAIETVKYYRPLDEDTIAALDELSSIWAEME
ncbi:MAG: hypothetical protein ACFFKA_00240 [Candidatus Thorarchaeota archaeon]